MSERKRPIQLEWQGGLAENGHETDSTRVPLKGETKPKPSGANPVARAVTGEAEIHRESKGRAGHPVLVVKKFSDAAARGDALKQLCTNLKNRMACGGSIDEDAIVLQTTQVERLIETLAKMGIKGKKRF